MPEIINCPSCNQRLRIPSDKNLKITCTTCKHSFIHVVKSHSNEDACPSCGSADWKSLDHFYSEANKKSRQRIRAYISPPKEPKEKMTAVATWWATVLVVLWLIGKENTFIAFAFLVAAVAYWPKHKQNRDEQDAREQVDYHNSVNNWEQGRVCQKCGNVFNI